MSDRVPARLPALLGREHAILAFNRRAGGRRSAPTPLLERLRHICIVPSNLDEFFEVRFRRCPGGTARAWAMPAARGWLRWRPRRTARSTRSTPSSTTIDAAAAARRHRHPNHVERDAAQREWRPGFFPEAGAAAAGAGGAGSGAPGSRRSPKSRPTSSCGCRGTTPGAPTRSLSSRCRGAAARDPLPPDASPGRQVFVLLTSVIRAHLGELFPGRRSRPRSSASRATPT